MADHEVEEVDLPERILRVPAFFRRSDAVGDGCGKGSKRTRIGVVVIASNRDGLVASQKRFEQFAYALLDGAGIGPSEAPLEFGAAVLLVGRHPALSSQYAVGVVEKVAGNDIDGHIVMKREVLAELEALESVDDHLAGKREARKIPSLIEQAMPAETSNLVGHGGGSAPQGTCDLAVSHASDNHGEDGRKEVRTFLPVGRREGLYTKLTITGQTGKALDMGR